MAISEIVQMLLKMDRHTHIHIHTHTHTHKDTITHNVIIYYSLNPYFLMN